ncbi:MAG: peptide-methionine (S)-S-oxide reductase, partial [Sulfurimonas sp.]|nr:peptide-methionine (S)-S-oxide reductase [Sulfurimonas sp.]
GTQYRSVIYYENDKQKSEILNSIQKVQEGFSEKIVTEVSELGAVFEAENYHQDYYAQNSSQGYCQAVISPKLQKFMTTFPDKLG